MDAVNPWLDPSEVRHLAEQLLRPVSTPHTTNPDPGFSTAFVGFTTQSGGASFPPQMPKGIAEIPASNKPEAAFKQPEQHTEATRSTLPPIRIEPITPAPATPATPATPAPAASAPTPAVQPKLGSAFSLTPPTRPHKTRFLQRVQILRDWLEKHFQASDIFILDKDGRVIFDESGHGRLHFMARNLAHASHSADTENRNIHVKVGPTAILEVIPCDTPYGRIVLGALVPSSLSSSHVDMIAEVLVQTASPD